MKKVFVKTGNYVVVKEMCDELASSSGLIGPSMAMISGKAGRGKTEIAKHIAIQTDAIYIRTLPVMSARMVLAETVFDMVGIRPKRIEPCIEIINDEMSRKRRIIFVDEADLLKMEVLETLRGINERAHCPIILIGEEGLKQKVASRTRIASRIRSSHQFTPLNESDIAIFFKNAIGIEPDNAALALLLKSSGGDWRPMIKTALGIEKAIRASKLNSIPVQLVKAVLGDAK